MISIMKNNMHRLLEKKVIIVMMFALTLCSILAALFFASQPKSIAHIAVVRNAYTEELSSSALSITYVDKEPPISSMLLGDYDAVVTFSKTGNMKLDTIRSKDVEQSMKAALQNADLVSSNEDYVRGIGATIIGFMLAFILMQGTTLMMLYAEDQEAGQLKRIVSSPVKLWQYLVAQGLFNFCLVFFPAMFFISVIKILNLVNIGFSFLEYSFLIALICLFSTAFSMFIHSLLKKNDSAVMAGSGIIILTSILSGSFYSFDKGETSISKIIQWLPQKKYLTIVYDIEKGLGIANIGESLAYVIIWIVFCFTIAFILNVKQSKRL